MNYQYVYLPRNPILWHCGKSFYKVLTTRAYARTGTIQVDSVIHQGTWALLTRLIEGQSQNESVEIYLLAVQSNYVALALLLRLIALLCSSRLRIYYLMHEPKLEKGRVNPVKTFLINIHQVVLGYLSHTVLLPSDIAIAQAKGFIPQSKIAKVSLTFASVPNFFIVESLKQLETSWANQKTFSMIGTVSSQDKNPWGFLRFSNIANKALADQSRFIRAGRDNKIEVSYDEDVIVRVPSYLSENTKRFFFGISHFIVVPYSNSTQSGVVAEALSYGKLLVLSDISAFSDFRNCNFSFMVDFEDSKSISRCIESVVSMSFSSYKERSLAALQYFKTHYSETRLSEDIDKLKPVI